MTAQAAWTTDTHRFCTACGGSLPVGAAFCGRCGAAASGMTARVPRRSPVVDAAPWLVALGGVMVALGCWMPWAVLRLSSLVRAFGAPDLSLGVGGVDVPGANAAVALALGLAVAVLGGAMVVDRRARTLWPIVAVMGPAAAAVAFLLMPHLDDVQALTFGVGEISPGLGLWAVIAGGIGAAIAAVGARRNRVSP